MKEKKFKVGDRVRVIGKIGHSCEIGDTGVIRSKTLNPVTGLTWYAVELDRGSNAFHICDGTCKKNHGQWIKPCDLELIERPPQLPTINPTKFRVIIDSDGECTGAKLLHGKKVVREAEVNRYYKDEHDEQTAIEAVVAKMFPLKTEEKAKEDTHHDIRLLVCVNAGKSSFATSHDLHEGDIYTVIDGRIKHNGGTIYSGYTSAETLNMGTGCNFVEVYNNRAGGVK